MDFPSKAQNNKVAVFLVGAVGGIGGSALTVLWVVSAIWAAAMLALRKIPAIFASSDLWLCIAATVYVAAILLSAIVNGATPQDFFTLYPILVFLFPWVIIPRLRLSKPEDLIGSLVLGAAICGLLALPVAAFQIFVLGFRSMGGAGNPIPFGLICTIAGQLSLLNTVYESRWRIVLGWCGYLAAFSCLLFSATRGLLPAIFLGPVVLLIVFPNVRAQIFNRRGLIGLIVALVGLAFTARPMLDRIMISLSRLSSGAEDVSVSGRLELWSYALELFKSHPILGNGTQNRLGLIHEGGFGFGHFHNGFLISLVDGGIIGLATLLAVLAAPLIVAGRSMETALSRERLFLAVVLISTYAIGGFSNFIFWHDIYDSLFLWVAAIIVASRPLN